MRFLVTAGSTRERIDRVRDWGNVFTGNTGYSIACALAGIGDVDLVTSNTAHLQHLQPPIHGRPFVAHADLKLAIETLVRRNDYHAIFMTAAVADYSPQGSYEILNRTSGADGLETWTVRNVQAAKVKGNYQQVAFAGRPNEKLIDLFRGALGYQGLIVKFKLEVGIAADELIRIGQASRRQSGADYLVANTLEMVGGQNAGAYLLSDAGVEWMDRSALPARMVQLAREKAAKAR